MANLSKADAGMTTVEMERILKSKQAMRSRLAALPICEKLRLLDELRERAVTLAASRDVAKKQEATS